ncbi:MAG TPA: alpha/beta fold hydrolase [Candidatus Binatia bacterium]|nr:alpha/beta fold hydrolase [Candidatus Binatia bacterium]
MPRKYVHVDGTAVHYLHTGATTPPDVPPALDRGRVFLFVHAAGSNAGMWRRQLEGLASRHSAVAPDLPGHGRSSGVDGLPTVEAYADFLARFADLVCPRPFVLVGRSMGGAVALVFAARHPSRCAGLVLTCTAARFELAPDRIRAVYDVVRGRLPQQFTTETFSPATGMDLVREAWMEQVKTDPRVRHGDLLACQAFDGRPLLAGIRTPTLVVAGADDGVTPVGQSEQLARGIPGARLEVIERAGHQAPLEQSERYNGLLAAFAEGLA